MAKKIFLADIDLALNQLLQARLENLAADPTAAVGRVYYNTTVNKAKVYNGSAWVELIDSLDPRLTNARVPTPHVLATNTGLGAEHTISGAAAGWVLKALTATTAAFAQLAHSDLSGVGSNTHAQIDTHIGTAAIHRQINDNGSSNTELFSASKILSLINDLSSVVAGALVFIGSYDAATNTPNLDVTPIAGIKKGHTYIVTAAGQFFTEDMSVGDLIIAKQDNPTTLAHWTTVNKNIPDIVNASESARGIVELSTQAETNAGTDDSTAVTPLKLHTKLGITGTLSVARKFQAAISGSAVTYAITHNLNSASVIVQVHRTASPFDVVECEIVKTSVNVVTLNFNVAPTSGEYTVTIVG